MTEAPKYILHSPLSDETRLDAFVEHCLKENASLIAVVGPGSSRIEDIIDEIIVGDAQYDYKRFICTTSHPDETYEDVLEFVKFDHEGAIHEVRL